MLQNNYIIIGLIITITTAISIVIGYYNNKKVKEKLSDALVKIKVLEEYAEKATIAQKQRKKTRRGNSAKKAK
tara:strand:- start:90 stop:308 length:219 start_codon:yes stop_codon:yes gene_type:complete